MASSQTALFSELCGRSLIEILKSFSRLAARVRTLPRHARARSLRKLGCERAGMTVGRADQVTGI